VALRVNGAFVPASRIGRDSQVPSRKLQVQEFVGINLMPGSNTIELTQASDDGEPERKHAIVVRAPGSQAQLRLVVPTEAQPADGRSRIKVTIESLDAAGLPVTSPTAVTLNASNGRWLAEDLDAKEPGVQVFVEGGQLVAELEAPNEAGDVQLRATSGPSSARATIAFVPSLRPLIAAGVVEGVFNLRQLDRRSIQTVRKQDGFEQALSRVGGSIDDGRADAGARAALFIKGKVLGSTLLTLAYDSAKEQRERLFRDIQPGEFYPIYGDDSVQGFDAQSTGRLYVKLERGKSSLLYGDFSTQTITPQRPGSVALDERRLGQYSRSLNGARMHLESDDSQSSLTAFASQTTSRQVIDELPALGISGPYALSRAPLIENSEKVELLTRDRDQPSLIVRTQYLQRFVDYEVEVLTGRLLFKGPVPSLDAAFNPQSLRVSYEVDRGGASAWVGGVAGRHEITDRLAVSSGIVRDSDEQKPLTLTSVGATLKFSPETALHAEHARSDTPLGLAASGQAARVELRHDGDMAKVQVQAVRAGGGFDNPSAGVTAGRQEISAKASVKLDEQTALKAEVLRTDDLVNETTRNGALIVLEHRLTEQVRAEVGARHSSGVEPGISAAAAATSTPTTSLRAKLSAQVPGAPRATVFGEVEQDIEHSERKVAALGGEYRIDSTSRVYARHEFISSLGSRYALADGQQRNASVLGVQTDYAADANLFSEYRLRDAFGGRETEAAIGLRNRWRLGEGWALTTGFERVHTLGSSVADSTAGSGESKVIALGVEYTGAANWKGATRLEVRGSRNSDSLLSTGGLSLKIDDAWSALARNTLSITRQPTAGDKTEDWLQLGLAWREAGANKRNALLRAEYRFEATGEPLLADSRRDAVILSAHGSQQQSERLALNGRLAAKAVREQAVGQTSRYHAELASARATYDLTSQWDLSTQVAALIGGGGRARQLGLGAEAGYRLADNLWVSGGWNLFGFTDRDLTAQDTTQQGLFLRLRWKFDERLFETKP
jgi:large repetitive protein